MNIVCLVRLGGGVTPDQLASALARVQQKHPLLRAVVREERDGLYYEAESARSIRLRVAERQSDDDYRDECRRELRTKFAPDEPQLRAVLLRSEHACDLLLTTSHRMCDGASVFLLAGDVLHALSGNGGMGRCDLVTIRNLIDGHRASRSWRHAWLVRVSNALLPLIPGTRHAPKDQECELEWSAGRDLSAALVQRCRTEGISVHAFLVVTLESALFRIYGHRLPKRIVSPIDMRRGRFPALKSGTIFFGGGSIQVGTEPSPDFWTRARQVHGQLASSVQAEIEAIPGRLSRLEAIRPLSAGQIRWIVRLSDALRLNPSWNRFGFSNIGRIAIEDIEAPFRARDLRLYVHSFDLRMLGLVCYTVAGDMHFYAVSGERCLRLADLERLQCEFMEVTQRQVGQVEVTAAPAPA